jgi:hypothetical protein
MDFSVVRCLGTTNGTGLCMTASDKTFGLVSGNFGLMVVVVSSSRRLELLWKSMVLGVKGCGPGSSRNVLMRDCACVLFSLAVTGSLLK